MMRIQEARRIAQEVRNGNGDDYSCDNLSSAFGRLHYSFSRMGVTEDLLLAKVIWYYYGE